MPAPLAKGLIISLSLLFAAGVAVYENPHVRQWVDESRRKVAIALHSLGDDLSPTTEERQTTREDASAREDESPEAVERRRLARQEILERGRLMEEKRRAARQAKGEGMCFDDLVDKDGTLKADEGTAATSTAAEAQPDRAGLRQRVAESKAAALGSNFANPFEDETLIDNASPSHNRTENQEVHSRSATSTMPASPPVPPKPAAYQPHRLLIDTDSVSNHPSEQLVDLTPTTSASATTDLVELDQGERQPSPASYWSVDEWAQNHSVQSLHPPHYVDQAAGMGQGLTVAAEGSLAGSVEQVSQVGTEDMDILSDFGDVISTPGTWTEVGSQASEE
ncbi:MAG: hypothetical protein Q9217_004539 [Psora testacea]